MVEVEVREEGGSEGVRECVLEGRGGGLGVRVGGLVCRG